MSTSISSIPSQLDHHRERVQANARIQGVLQRKLSAPQILDAGRYSAEKGSGGYSAAGYEVGKWVQPSGRDTNMKTKMQLMQRQKRFIQGTKRETS